MAVTKWSNLSLASFQVSICSLHNVRACDRFHTHRKTHSSPVPFADIHVPCYLDRLELLQPLHSMAGYEVQELWMFVLTFLILLSEFIYFIHFLCIVKLRRVYLSFIVLYGIFMLLHFVCTIVWYAVQYK